MANVTYKTVPIDKQKFVDCFKKKDLLMREASIKCGVSEWYLSNQANRGKMSESVARLLEVYYNIRPEDYAPDEVKPASVVKQTSTEVDYDKLSNAINKAVYDAITDAFDVIFDKYVRTEIDAELKRLDKKKEEV